MEIDNREQEIQKLCKQVLEMSAESYSNLNGADTTTCPMCNEKVYTWIAGMEDIKHNAECGYLIAKDLSTNLI